MNASTETNVNTNTAACSIFIKSYDEVCDLFAVTVHNSVCNMSTDMVMPAWLLPHLGVVGEPAELVGWLHPIGDPIL